MYLYFPSLGTWIIGDGTVRYFFPPPPSLKEPAIEQLLRNLVALIPIIRRGMLTQLAKPFTNKEQ